MTSQMRHTAGAAALALGVVAPIAAGQGYGIVEIPTLGGGFSEALDLNAQAQVVGVAETVSGDTHAILFSAGVVTDLGTLGGATSLGHAINDTGWVAGEAQLPGGDFHAFVWTPGGGMTDIGTLGGAQSAGFDINNNGFVTGWSHDADGGNPHTFRYDGAVMTDLVGSPSDIGGLFSRGYGINDTGTIVGEATQIFTKLATKWEGNNAILLSTTENTRALAINDFGDAVGDYPFAGWSIWWRPSGTFLVLFIDEANDINNAQQVAGSLGGQAVVWDNGVVTDLNDLLPAGSGWVLQSARAINDLGQVAGVGTLDGEPRGFLLTELAVDLLDPVLPLMTGLDVNPDPQVLATTIGRSVIGVTADGVTRLVVRLSGLPGPGTVQLQLLDEVGGTAGVGTLRTPGGSEDVTTLEVPVTMLPDGRAMALAVYVAPDDFIRGLNDTMIGVRVVNLGIAYQPSGAGSLVLASKPFVVRRPPVVLLHGLWSKAKTWKMPIETDSRFLVFAQDYERTNAGHFVDNIIQARRGVQEALMMARRLGLAATQADVVGHSMGGLLTRMYISDTYGDPRARYGRQDNFGEGDVNRLITLDTPHKGSPLANVLLDPAAAMNFVMGTAYIEALNLLPLLGCVNCGAVFDLKPNSPVIQNLPGVDIPVHAMVGKGGSDIIQLGLELSLLTPTERAILQLLRAVGVDLAEVFPPAIQHDMIVGRESQEGGLTTGSSQTSVFGLFDPGPLDIAIHLTVTGHDRSVATRIIELLNTPVTDPLTYAAGFEGNGSGGGGAVAAGITLPDYGDVIDGLVITDPLPDASVAPGDMLSVTVQATDGFVPVHVLAYSPLGTAFSDKPPFDVSIEVPLEAIGASVVNAFAFDVDWNMAVADPIAVQIEVAAVLTGIDVDPQEVFLFSFGPDYQLRVTGHYDDGIDREITDAALGTVYQSLDPGIVTIDVDGVVTAVSVGTATVQAASGALTATAQVEVVNLTCQGDIDQDGVVTVGDFLFLLSSWGLAESPADIVDPPGVGIEDFLALLANWGPCPSQ